MVSPRETNLISGLTLWLAALAALGADPLVVGAGVALFGSDVGVRLIRLRQTEREAALVSPTRWALTVPLVVALVARDPRVTDIASYVATGGILTTKADTLDSAIIRQKREIVDYTKSMDDYLAQLKKKYGMMEGALNSLEQSSQSISNFARQNGQ